MSTFTDWDVVNGKNTQPYSALSTYGSEWITVWSPCSFRATRTLFVF